MKKIIFCISLMISLFILLSCHDFHLQEDLPVPDGYQRVVFRPAGSEGGLAKTVIMPDLPSLVSSESSQLSLKAEVSGSDGSNSTYTGSYSTGVVAELKTGITYTVILSLVNASDTVFLSGSKSVTPAGGGTSSESIELSRVVPEADSDQTGDIELRFTCSTSDFAYKILWPDGSTSSANNKTAREEVTVTKNGLSAGLHKVYFGLYTGEEPSETDISFYKCIDVYVYAGQTSSLWINGDDTATVYDFAGEEGAFSSSETTYFLNLTAEGKEYTQDNLPFQVITGDLTEDMHLQITLGVPGQKVEVFINNSPTPMSHTVSEVNSALISTLDYNLGKSESLSIKVMVTSPDNSETTYRFFTIKNPYALSYSDTSSIAGLLGWTGSSAFRTDTLDYAGLSLDSTAYTIYTKEELVQFSNLVNSGIHFSGCKVELKSDISLKGIEWIPVGYYSSSENKPFKGTFDGGGFTVSDLNVGMSASDTDTAGFFGYVLEGNVKNLNCYGTVKGGNKYVGGIVGYFKNVTTGVFSIENCYFNGTVESSNNQMAGGIVGFFYTNYDALISGCHSEGNLNCNNLHAGGIAGYVYHTKILNCYNKMSIDNSANTSSTGGIVGTVIAGSGTSLYAEITNCVNYGAVKATGTAGYGAGIVAACPESYVLTLNNCVNFGEVKDSYYSNGIAYTKSNVNIPLIKNCYNVGSVSKKDNGYAYSIIGSKLTGEFSCYYITGGPDPCPSFDELAEGVCSTIEEACGGTYTYEAFKDKLLFTDENGNTTDYTYEYNGKPYPVPIECK